MRTSKSTFKQLITLSGAVATGVVVGSAVTATLAITGGSIEALMRKVLPKKLADRAVWYFEKRELKKLKREITAKRAPTKRSEHDLALMDPDDRAMMDKVDGGAYAHTD